MKEQFKKVFPLSKKSSAKNSNNKVSGTCSCAIHGTVNNTMPDVIYDLLGLLIDLDGVVQSVKYHPERDALYHSLQVFQCAQAETNDPELLAAALFHDVGKAIDYPNHARVGAEVLSAVLNDRVCWLVERHLDLLINSKRCRKKYANTSKLSDLEKLRRWDLAGRQIDADVVDENTALDMLKPHFCAISSSNALAVL